MRSPKFSALSLPAVEGQAVHVVVKTSTTRISCVNLLGVKVHVFDHPELDCSSEVSAVGVGEALMK
jgi:hypothetical protein